MGVSRPFAGKYGLSSAPLFPPQNHSLLPQTLINRLLFRYAPFRLLTACRTVNTHPKNVRTTAETAALRSQQVPILYASIPVSLLGNALIALILAGIQSQVLAASALLIWLTVLGVALAFRWLLLLRYRKASQPEPDLWLRRFRLSMLATGVAWGLASILTFPVNTLPHQAFLAFAIAGLTAGANTTLSVDRQSLLAFTLPTLIGLITRLLTAGTTMHIAMAAMVMLYLLFTDMIARRTHAAIVENILLRHAGTLREQALRSSMERMKQAQQIAHLGSFEWDLRNNTLQWSDEHFRLWGLPPHSTTPSQALFLRGIHPDDTDKVAQTIGNARRSRQRYTLNHRVVWPDGSERYMQNRGEVVTDTVGNAVAIKGTVQDITERRQTEEDLRIAAIAFESLEGIVITDTQKLILKVNRAFTHITGYSSAEAIGNPLGALLKSSYHDSDFYRQLWQTLDNEGSWQGEIWSSRKNGEAFPAALNLTSVTAKDGVTSHYVATFFDITEQKKSAALIHNLAFYDPLTELPNRRQMQDKLQFALLAGLKHHQHGALLFIDLDKFKELNDTKGHHIGDLLLVEIAKRMKRCVGNDDTVSRQGGDEFVVILTHLSDDFDEATAQAEQVAEKIRDAINQPFNLQGQDHYSSTSIGISLFRHNEFSVDELLLRADTAMYQAKRCGRNTIRFFDPTTHAAMEVRIGLEADLRTALLNNEFSLYYQIQTLDSGYITGAEALLRWHHPEQGLIAPVKFIPLTEEIGLITEIGYWTLETACIQLKAWADNPATAHLQLSVNVSPRQFHQDQFVEKVSAIITNTGIDASKLKLELTESLVLDDMNDTIKKMNRLKKMGVQFSLDDFGTGYSSLSYLTQLPLDQLKIDKSFVHNLTLKNADNVIVQTIIGMAITLGLDVIAEGVETAEQAAFLKANYCYHYQGYLFGKPVPLAEFEAALADMPPIKQD
ncbi:diguanylate cyclase [Methylovulum psychrotolerans]|uniref:cyclic-guanylate-specific phosphodiesterase n=1 Tax=Methylovulum psychrotolerans TaxID=1704499 RepID=A0A2S5CSX2_9GAMM|nr:diguanylate cyclase [Methylovulum psychrotolerans]